MKYPMLLFLALPLTAHGQTAEPDSTAVFELGELTVTADGQRADADKTVYIPTVKQKATASGGVSLLQRMQIPQLSVNPVGETVKTADNQVVGFFINYHPASTEDVAGLNPKDVKSVEYLDFPSDPRFMRAQHAVNFITHSYSYGGYTKLSGKERFMAHSGDGAVYSKFACRSMEYVLIISGEYDRNPHTGEKSEETYRLAFGEIERKSVTETARHREQGLYAGLRASWAKGGGLSWRNLVSYHRVDTPVDDTSGSVGFSDLYPSSAYHTEGSSANNAAAWDSELYASPGRGWSLNGTFRAELRDNRSSQAYSAGAASIIDNADEKSWWLRGDAKVNKSLSDRVMLFASTSAGGGRTRIDYYGSAEAINRFRQTFSALYAGASLNFRKVSGSIDAGYAFESNRINGKTMHDSYPFTHINVQYAPNGKNSLSLWLQYATMSPDATMKNPNIIRRSELMYVGGNPDLKCSRHLSANVSYTWLPSNRWQMSAFATAFRIADRQIAVYTPDGPGGMMLKKYQNNGDYNHGQAGASVTGKFFGGRLSCHVSPRLLLYRTTGSNSITHTRMTATARADFYLGDFYFNTYWESGSSYVDGETAYLRRMPPLWSITAGWARKGWNVQVSAVNPWRSSWAVSEDTLDTRRFDSAVTQYGSYSHRRIAVSVVYTFNYGKKVSTEEIRGEGSISSAILR